MIPKAIIFDLDDTIFRTEVCKPYLRTSAGREVIPELIKSGEVVIDEMYPGIVIFINSLISSGVGIYVISDSPKDYCTAVLLSKGIEIHEDNVFGSQNKPCVEQHVFYDYYDDILVIGDSPKDIYFAHMNDFPSVMLADLSPKGEVFYKKWTKPGEVCKNLNELKNIVSDFLQDNFCFYKNDFKSMYLTLNVETAKIVNIPSANIGHSFEYWPNINDAGEDTHKLDIWFDVKRSIKVAKELTKEEIEKGSKVLFYNKNKTIGSGRSFKAIMWVYFQEFKKWVASKNIEGKIYLVPAPPSVPMECNKSFPILILIDWWAKYAYHDKEVKFEIEKYYSVDRFWPTIPAHMSNGPREVRPHFESLGVYPKLPKVSNASALIIIDDIVTSGTQMSAVASMLLGCGLFLDEIPLYGYALARTTRSGFNTSELLKLFSDSEKAGA
ncbi:hypothetical protein ACROQ8_002646 [Yersinia enterocolitica]|uniref:hypothetical protein n=1 Tax=Yersinia TaxID=629 RepID=UPI0003D93530|nr:MULTISPECIES: hypothetical protein [Yersinia]EME3602465.1 hypothetical protein [Yersinia enterocolitica]CCQ38885.1 hypothetical protein YE5303_01751 [Yersinia enterocolitica (type O:5) str. YE53/03]HDL7379628.1 hypothetical protein [Yersinia enterocolitica]